MNWVLHEVVIVQRLQLTNVPKTFVKNYIIQNFALYSANVLSKRLRELCF